MTRSTRNLRNHFQSTSSEQKNRWGWSLQFALWSFPHYMNIEHYCQWQLQVQFFLGLVLQSTRQQTKSSRINDGKKSHNQVCIMALCYDLRYSYLVMEGNWSKSEGVISHKIPATESNSQRKHMQCRRL